MSVGAQIADWANRAKACSIIRLSGAVAFIRGRDDAHVHFETVDRDKSASKVVYFVNGDNPVPISTHAVLNSAKVMEGARKLRTISGLKNTRQ